MFNKILISKKRLFTAKKILISLAFTVLIALSGYLIINSRKNSLYDEQKNLLKKDNMLSYIQGDAVSITKIDLDKIKIDKEELIQLNKIIAKILPFRIDKNKVNLSDLKTIYAFQFPGTTEVQNQSLILFSMKTNISISSLEKSLNEKIKLKNIIKIYSNDKVDLFISAVNEKLIAVGTQAILKKFIKSYGKVNNNSFLNNIDFLTLYSKYSDKDVWNVILSPESVAPHEYIQLTSNIKSLAFGLQAFGNEISFNCFVNCNDSTIAEGLKNNIDAGLTMLLMNKKININPDNIKIEQEGNFLKMNINISKITLKQLIQQFHKEVIK